MSKQTYVIALGSCLFLVANLAGCGSGGQTSAVDQDELSAYLDEHPESKDLEYVPPTLD